MKPVRIPNMLLIAGTGRNCGKTAFACTLIRRFGGQAQVFALKISHHDHHRTDSDTWKINEDSLAFMEETNPGGNKDSSRMLEAGAFRSFFAVCKTETHPGLLNEMVRVADKGALWIVESAGLRHVVEPGVFVLVDYTGRETQEKPDVDALRRLQPYPVWFDGQNFGTAMDHISISKNKWILI